MVTGQQIRSAWPDRGTIASEPGCWRRRRCLQRWNGSSRSDSKTGSCERFSGEPTEVAGAGSYFMQEHRAGELERDFTHLSEFGNTIAGQPFPHMLYHFVLTFSINLAKCPGGHVMNVTDECIEAVA